jgi:hypothetical protein
LRSRRRSNPGRHAGEGPRAADVPHSPSVPLWIATAAAPPRWRRGRQGHPWHGAFRGHPPRFHPVGVGRPGQWELTSSCAVRSALSPPLPRDGATRRVVEPVIDLVVSNAEHAIPAGPEISIAPAIVADLLIARVGGPVDLDNQARLTRGEIADERPDRLLPHEFVPLQPPVSEMRPQARFRRRLRPAQGAGTAGCVDVA